MSESPSPATPEPAPETKTVTAYIVIALSLAGIGVIVWRIADVFAVGFGGLVFAAAIRALALPISRRTKLSPRLSVGVVVVGLVIVFAMGGWLFGTQVTEQISELRRRLPEASRLFLNWLTQSDAGRAMVESARRTVVDSKLLANVGIAAGALLTFLTDLILIVLVAIYFAVDPRLYRAGALRLLPPRRRGQFARALDDAGFALRRWLLGQLIAMVTVGLMTGASLALLGVPFAISLGVLTAVFEFIPVLGPILAAIPGVLLAFTVSPQMAVYSALVYFGVQQIESNVLTPLLQRWAIELPPVVGLLSVLACGLLFGVMGVVFATPIAVVIIAMVRHLYVEDTLENNGAKSRNGRH